MILKITSIAFAATLFLASCAQPEGQKVESSEAAGTAAVASAAATAFTIDPATSLVGWEGAKPTGKHTGLIPVTGGTISVLDGNITAGSFDLNVAGLTVTDLKDKPKADLEDHLKAGDFFDVAKFPGASFTITKVEPAAAGTAITHNITGDLKMRDKTKSITIPATVAIVDGKLTADVPAFVINRLDWGVQYNSATLTGTAKDKIISDNVGINIKLVANAPAAAPAAN